MRTFEATVQVDDGHRAMIQLPDDVPPGPHRLVVTIDPEMKPRFRLEDLPRHDVPWPFTAGETFRREDIYGDEGR